MALADSLSTYTVRRTGLVPPVGTGNKDSKIRARKKPVSDCSEQVNFSPGQAKMEVWLSGGQVKLASVSIPVSDNFQLKAFQNSRLQDEQNLVNGVVDKA